MKPCKSHLASHRAVRQPAVIALWIRTIHCSAPQLHHAGRVCVDTHVTGEGRRWHKLLQRSHHLTAQQIHCSTSCQQAEIISSLYINQRCSGKLFEVWSRNPWLPHDVSEWLNCIRIWWWMVKYLDIPFYFSCTGPSSTTTFQFFQYFSFMT